MNADDLIRQVKDRPRFRMEVGLVLDAVAFAEARRLNDRLARLQTMPDDDDVTAEGAAAISDRLVAIYRETPETRFTLEARSASEWETLHREFADPQEFTVALFAASCVDPSGWTLDGARQLKDSLTAGQWATLVLALQQLNEGLFDLRPTRAATAMMTGMRQNSTTALPEESDIQSS